MNNNLMWSYLITQKVYKKLAKSEEKILANIESLTRFKVF